MDRRRLLEENLKTVLTQETVFRGETVFGEVPRRQLEKKANFNFGKVRISPTTGFRGFLYFGAL